MNTFGRVVKNCISILKKPIYLLRNNHYGKGTIVEKNVFMQNTCIGKYCYIGPNSSYNDTVIGNYCSLSTGSQIGGMEHPYKNISTSTILNDSWSSEKITIIGNDVWIGAESIIKLGVKIGNGAVVGANSFVTKDVPPYAIVFGNPARIYQYRFNQVLIDEIEESKYWDYSPEEAKKKINEITKSSIEKNNYQVTKSKS